MAGVLIFSTNDGHAMNIMKCLSALNIRTCIIGNGKSISVKSSRYCENYYIYDLLKNIEEEELCNLSKENDNIIKDINNYCRQQELDIIIPAGIGASLLISKINNKINEAKVFPITDLETLKILNNKWTFTNLMNKNDLPCPKTIMIDDIHDISQIRSLDMEFPVIVKPLEGKGGVGVVKLNSIIELEAYISKDGELNKPPLIIQDYIPGMDIDISILAKDGEMLAYTIQLWQNKGIIKFIKDEKIAEIGRRFVKCCNYNGVAHIDMRLDNRDESIKIIECNPRFWASLEASLLSGINFPCLGILIAQNKELPKNIDYKDIRYIVPDMVLVEILRSMSFKDVFTGHNLYFIRGLIQDPLYYFYFIPIFFTKILIGMIKRLRYYIFDIRK